MDRTPAYRRAEIAARDLAFLVGRDIADGNHITTYYGDAECDLVLPAISDGGQPDDVALELLADYLAAQATLARYCNDNLIAGIYAEAHAHLGMAQTSGDAWRKTMHLRIVETAAAMILAALHRDEHTAALEASKAAAAKGVQ